jgi:hypothetical protein
VLATSWNVYFQFVSPWLAHTPPLSGGSLLWVKPPLLEAPPEPGKHWKVPAVIAGYAERDVLRELDNFKNISSPASYWRNLRPLPPEEIGIWPGWKAFAVDLYIDINHLCEV